MSNTRIQRRLAAIMAADVAGYARLMEADEEGTLQRLAAGRVFMDRLIGEHGGRIVNTAGDSVLAEFSSVVDAVVCAVAIQRAIADANLGTGSHERFSFRIGIHVGDVMVRDGDLFGEGVNIAARLESLATPGGIAFSGRVQEEIAGKLPPFLAPAAENAGLHVLKNIAAPITVWHIRLDPSVPLPGAPGQVRPSWRMQAAVAAAVVVIALAVAVNIWLVAPQPPTYTLLAFTAQGDSASARQLANELTTRLAGGLGAIPNIRLLSSASATTPKAQFAVSGTVIPGRPGVRVEANLVETATGRVLGAFGFDAPEEDVADMEEEILGAVGEDISVAINRQAFPPPAPTPDTERARALVQEARTRTDLRTDTSRAIGLYEEAIRLSPEDKDIAGWYANALIAFAGDLDEGSADRSRYLMRAAAILEDNTAATTLHRLLAYAKCQYFNHSQNPEAASPACDQVRRLLPWSARVYKEIGGAYMRIGLFDGALSAFRQAERLNHRTLARWTWATHAGIVCLLLDRNTDARTWLTEAADIRKDDPGIQTLLALADHRSGDAAGERRQLQTLAGFGRREAFVGYLDARINQLSFQEPTAQSKWRNLHQEFVDMLAQ